MFIDFVKLYAGAKIVAAGHGHQIYDAGVQSQWMNDVVSPSHYDAAKYIQYPPYDFALATPLTVLPLISSYAVWTIATMLLGLAAMVYLRGVSGHSLSLIGMGTLALLYVGSLFSFNSIILGQTAWLMLAIVCIFFAAMLKKREFLCGLTIVASTIKPQLLLLLAPPLLVRKMWRSVALAMVLEVVLLALAAGTVGWENVVLYPQILAHAESDLYGRDNERMVSIRGLTSALFGGSAGFVISLGSVAIALALIIWFWRQADDRLSQFRAISLSVLIFLILSPHSFLYDCLLLAVPTILLVPETSLSGAFAQRPLSKKSRSILLMFGPSLVWLPYMCLHPEVWASRFLLATNIAVFALWLKRDALTATDSGG